MLVVLSIMITMPIVGALIAFDYWHCSVRKSSFNEPASESRRA